MRALNASLSSIFGGLKPRLQQTLRDRDYFLFPDGQVRRQIGHGHSHAERRARKDARKLVRGRGQSLGDVAGLILSKARA